MNTPSLTKLNGLTMAHTQETGEVVVAIDRCSGLVESHLFLVTLSRPFEGRRPVTSMHYVIAPDAEEAICQVEANAFPECDYVETAQRESITSTAVQIPFHVRGWGRQVF